MHLGKSIETDPPNIMNSFVCIPTLSLSLTESVYIVGLKGEPKSNKPMPQETTFSQDVDSIGENLR